jgi:hypothetical protein
MGIKKPENKMLSGFALSVVAVASLVGLPSLISL